MNKQDKAEPAAIANSDTKAGPVKLEMKDPAIQGHAEKLVQATQGEAKAREDAGLLVTNAASNTWAALRNETAATLKELGHANAGLVLDVYLLNSKQIGGITATRATQYAANLRRMVKAAALGKELPAHILNCGRDAYLNDAFWSDAGILAKTGTKKGKATTEAGKAANANKSQATDAAKEMAADAVSQAAKEANVDKGMREVAELFARLHGPFRAEAYTRTKELLQSILKKQGAASGTGQQ